MRRRLERLLAALSGPDETLVRQCGRVADWERLFEHAFEHGVAGVLLRRIASAGIAVPAPARAAAERQLALDRLWHRRTAAEVRRVLRAFAESGPRTVVLKGPLLAERLYPEASLRPSGDLDLLARPADAERARETLERIGYRQRPGTPPLAAVVFDRPGARDRTVDLHHRASAGFGTTLEADDLVARSVRYRTAEAETAWILSPEDELLYLAVHAARHRFLRLRWLYELQLFVARHPDLDWQTIAARARALRVRRAVAAACEALERRLSFTLPQPARALLRRGGLRSRAALVAATLSAARSGGIRGKSYRVFWHLTYQALLGEEVADSARFWWRSLARAAGKLRGELARRRRPPGDS